MIKGAKWNSGCGLSNLHSCDERIVSSQRHAQHDMQLPRIPSMIGRGLKHMELKAADLCIPVYRKSVMQLWYTMVHCTIILRLTSVMHLGVMAWAYMEHHPCIIPSSMPDYLHGRYGHTLVTPMHPCNPCHSYSMQTALVPCHSHECMKAQLVFKMKCVCAFCPHIHRPCMATPRQPRIRVHIHNIAYGKQPIATMIR